jgi:hypothetical protein
VAPWSLDKSKGSKLATRFAHLISPSIYRGVCQVIYAVELFQQFRDWVMSKLEATRTETVETVGDRAPPWSPH